MTLICCSDVVSQSTNRDGGMTVISCWYVVIQSTNRDGGDDSMIFLGPGQSEYQWRCG